MMMMTMKRMMNGTDDGDDGDDEAHDGDDDGDDDDDENLKFVFSQVELIDTIMSIPSCLQVHYIGASHFLLFPFLFGSFVVYSINADCSYNNCHTTYSLQCSNVQMFSCSSDLLMF